MAKFLLLNCDKCGKEFQIMHGPTRSSSHIPKEEFAVLQYERNEELLDGITEHERSCGGQLKSSGMGFAD
jgi:hypothetical protein